MTTIDEIEDAEPFCYTCVSSAYWVECESCLHGWVEADWDGLSDDDCPMRCLWCNGNGGWWECLGSEHHDLEPGSIHRIPFDKRPEASDGVPASRIP